MFCPNCGKEITPGAEVCFGCGIMLDKMFKKVPKRASAGWWWLGFFLPLVGLILWATMNDSEPEKAKKCGIGALVGTIVSIGAIILIYALMIVGMIMLSNTIYY